MKKEIIFNLHREKGTNYFLVDFQDVYNYIGEGTTKEVELSFYLEKWCEFLNYYFSHSAPVHGDVKYPELRSWLNGYNYAKHIDEQEFHDRYILVMTGYVVTLFKPFEIKGGD